MFKKKKVDNKKIIESRRLIKEAQETIKLEKINIKKSKREEFRKTKFYKFMKKTFRFINFDRVTYSFSEVLVVTFLSLLVGAFACFSVVTILSGGKNYFQTSKELSKLMEVYEIITNNYNGDIDKNALIEEAINGMLSSVGDKYTGYFDSTSTEEFNEFVTGVYEGIGCKITNYEDKIKVVEVFDNGPSFKAGLLPDDLITSVDNQDVKGMTVEEVSNYIKGKKESSIDVVVLRGENEVKLTIIRGKVDTPVVTSKTFLHNGKLVGYLGISMFSLSSATQFSESLKKLEETEIDSLIIDVRGNNGGYLANVTKIVSELLPKGKVVYQVEKNEVKEKIYDKDDISRDYPIAVLINGSSASASEILAAAIKESYGGYVVGTTTYGKGTVQQTKKLSDGTMIKFTVENWLTPNGNWINDVGIEPTHYVKMEESYYKNPVDEADMQLQKALELVSE